MVWEAGEKGWTGRMVGWKGRMMMCFEPEAGQFLFLHYLRILYLQRYLHCFDFVFLKRFLLFRVSSLSFIL